MESQHRMACSGVNAAPQSDEYAKRATIRATKKICLARRIFINVAGLSGKSQEHVATNRRFPPPIDNLYECAYIPIEIL
jgi:hypothetical protein